MHIIRNVKSLYLDDLSKVFTNALGGLDGEKCANQFKLALVSLGYVGI